MHVDVKTNYLESFIIEKKRNWGKSEERPQTVNGRERETDRQTDRQRQRGRERERKRKRETERERQTELQADKTGE